MKPINRQRIYDTGIAVFGVLAVWGIISADEAAELANLIENVLGIAVLFLARRNVPIREEE